MLSNLEPVNDVIIKISKRDYRIEVLFAEKLSVTSDLSKEVEALREDRAVQNMTAVTTSQNYELTVQENWSVEAVAETIASRLETKYGLAVRRVKDLVYMQTFDPNIKPVEPERTITVLTRAD